MTWIQKQTSFRCSLAMSFPHKLELLSILISEISDERIGKQSAMGLSRDKITVRVYKGYIGKGRKEPDPLRAG